uniref:Deleted in malignant brain tumors 1 protein-like isoform X2 n=1 Tax=Geotrypetes seraphini TaxID=260995 RepID=A0A6P8PIS3_GEOSA|nr:deleted in malignant brain tumors 1 protein-like isoform X2 [Geotrypetes seraphini]
MACESLYQVLLVLLLHTEALGSGSIFQLELVGGPSKCEGRLEVTYRGTRGSVCTDDWKIPHAAVVCAQLGCGPARKAVTDNRFGAGNGNLCLSQIDCFGTEKELSACGQSTFSWVPRERMWDAGVVCSLSGISSVRLLNGPNMCTGRLEVAIGNDSGAVCNDAWGSQDAAVVCKELKCGAAMEMPSEDPTMSSPSGHVLLTSAFCSGSELSMSKCGTRMTSSGAPCTLSGEVEVNCAPNSGSLSLRLMDGVGSCDGRVEVQYNGTWGSVSQFHWDMEEARVVCRQQRCGEARRVMRHSHFGRGLGVVWLKDTYCNGSETQLSDCGLLISSQTLSPDIEDAVGVICEDPVTMLVSPLLMVRGAFYFIVYTMIHLIYFVVGKQSSRPWERGLRKRFPKSEEVVVYQEEEEQLSTSPSNIEKT